MSLEYIVGFSDHSEGIAMGPPAYVMGTRVFEKHFTLNRTWKGTDHAFSLEPNGMRRYIRDLKRTAQAMGTGVKQSYESEEKPLYKMGKGLYAARDMKIGDELWIKDITIKSPKAFYEPFEIVKLRGRFLAKNMSKDEPFDELSFITIIEPEKDLSQTVTASRPLYFDKLNFTKVNEEPF